MNHNETSGAVTEGRNIVTLKVQGGRKQSRLLKIRSSFHEHLSIDFDFHLYVSFIENVVEKMIPQPLLEEFKNVAGTSAQKKLFLKLIDQLPIVHWAYPEKTPGILQINLLCHSEYTHGVGRFLSDIISRWLIPGKILSISCSPSLNFQFVDFGKRRFYLTQLMIELYSAEDLEMIKTNIASVAREIRLTILSVKHVRNILSIKHLSIAQKAAVIQENLESLIERPAKDFNATIFDQVHQFLIKASAEEKILQINDKMQGLLKHKPNVFEAAIFYEIQHFILLFQDRFYAIRGEHHITRLIAFYYLFRKSLNAGIQNHPKERHLSFKLFPTQLLTLTGTRPVLGILIGMNILRENEIFEERHTFEAIQHLFPHVSRVKDSFVMDRRNQEKIRLFYFELEKEDGTSFTIEEIKQLKRLLPREVKASIENVPHQIFMPRNEEEVMRNIVLLSHELKYVRDIPQVVISFDTQTETKLAFTVILLRVLQEGDLSMQEFFSRKQSSVKFEAFDVKQVGLLRRKHIKEASTFTAKIDKAPFLRKDHSLDLFKARQAVSAVLSDLLGDIRDFNGGILSKQQELFHELRQSLISSGEKNDFLLENFFYSLTPPLMQSILPAPVLKTLYLMMAEALEYDFKSGPFFLKTHWDPEYLLLMTAAQNDTFREAVFAAVTQLGIPNSDLCFTFVKVYEIACLGYIYRNQDPKQCTLFYNTVQQSLER